MHFTHQTVVSHDCYKKRSFSCFHVGWVAHCRSKSPRKLTYDTRHSQSLHTGCGLRTRQVKPIDCSSSNHLRHIIIYLWIDYPPSKYTLAVDIFPCELNLNTLIYKLCYTLWNYTEKYPFMHPHNTWWSSRQHYHHYHTSLSLLDFTKFRWSVHGLSSLQWTVQN